MYSPFGCKNSAPLPRVYTCTCQTLLGISWWVKKCPTALLPKTILQIRSWLPHWCRGTDPSIHQSDSLPSKQFLGSLRIHTFLYTILLCRRELPSHLTDRWSSFEVAPSHLLMWRPENEPPPQDPIKAKPRVRGFDIHRLGNLCHQHILCHVRMITAY